MNRRMYGIRMAIILFVFGLCFLGGGVAVAATETDGQKTEDAAYVIERIPGISQMLPGESRYISTSIPETAVFETSNPEVVLVSNAGLVVAQKPGTAEVTQIYDGVKTIYKVKVNGEVDLIVFAGQSNMCGSGGSAAAAPQPDYGTAYEFDITTGTYQTILMKEPFGEGTNRIEGLEQTAENYSRKGTLVSAFCINYYKQTKVPVVGVSCSWGGSSTNTWLKRGLLTQTQKSVKAAKKHLKKHKVKIRHIYMVWYQGESDAAQGVTEGTYISRMKKIYKKIKKVGVEKVFVIRIGHDMMSPEKDYTIMKAQEKLCESNKNFILVSKKASKYRKSYPSYYSDTIHLNQKALNQVGYDAGKTAGKYVKKLKTK